MLATARFDLKIDAAEKELVARAAALMGTTMAGFVRMAAKEKAVALLEQKSRVVMTSRDFDAFNSALNDAFATGFAPNPALTSALAQAERVKRV
jgi:uncharacterized protein (DUF1778 family)